MPSLLMLVFEEVVAMQWIEREIIKVKNEIRQSLHEVYAAKGVVGRQLHIHNKLRELTDHDTPGGRLQRYVYTVSLLVHHLRHNHLERSQVKQAFNLAEALLVREAGLSTRGRTATLWGELFFLKSQLSLKEGSHWRALFEQFLGSRFMVVKSCNTSSFQLFTFGKRALRLGFGEQALASFSQAEEIAIGELWWQIRIARIRSLRLVGRPERAENLISDTLSKKVIPIRYGHECVWERLCIEVIDSGSVAHLLQMAKKSKCCYSMPEYKLEVALWGMASSEKKCLREVMNVSGIKGLSVESGLRGLRKNVAVLQRAYDYEVPIMFRYREVFKQICDFSRVRQVDKELLLWAALTRWLVRSRAYSLAHLAFLQYGSLSQKLSGGRQKDTLGILRDISDLPSMAVENDAGGL